MKIPKRFHLMGHAYTVRVDEARAVFRGEVVISRKIKDAA